MISTLADTQIQLAAGYIPGKVDQSYFPIGGNHVDLHQQEMYTALSNGESCILNSNPTGAGKTLSWAAPVIRRDSSTPNLVLVTYPTVELLRDQRETLRDYFSRYFRSDCEPWASETEYELVSDGEGQKKQISNGNQEFKLSDLILTVSKTADPTTSSTEQIKTALDAVVEADAANLPAIVLTTPDTLTLLSTNRFYDSDVGRLIPNMDAVVIDEFHLATDRARRLLPFHLDHYRTLSGRYLDSLVFLSATPNPSYVNRIERAYNVTTVTDQIVSDPSKTTAASTRPILPPTALGVTTRPRFTNGRWLAEHVGDLAAAHEPPGQLLIVVDGVREVERVAEAISQDTDLTAGRVYGWKREGRKKAIRTSDVIVGNTAVEVGVDFDNINRLIFTGYEPASALQRLGRMRAQSRFDDYRALLITDSSIQTALIGTGQELDRSGFDRALHEAQDTVERPYYDVLCGAYTWYLWREAAQPLEGEYVGREEAFREVAANHFQADFRAFFGASGTESFWEQAQALALSESLPKAVFEELHSYRSSSLNCVVLDTQDQEERVKRYNLSHVLRHREGEVISLDELTEQFERCFRREPADTEQAILQQRDEHAVVGFISTGTREKPREYYLRDFTSLHDLKRNVRVEGLHKGITTLSNPQPETRPSVEGIEKIDLDDETVLVQYVNADMNTARQRYNLGPYAAIVPTDEGDSLLLWDDAIKAHSDIVTKI